MLRDDKPESVHFGGFAVPEKISVFQLWIRKLLLRTNVQDAELLACNHRLMMCWFVAANEDRFRGADGLIIAADILVTDLLDMVLGYFDVIRELENRIRTFIVEYTQWHQASAVGFFRELRTEVIVTIYNCVRRPAVAEILMLKFRRLMIMYSMMDNRSASEFKSSPVYRAILLASRSSYFEPVVSQGKMLHEFVIEDDYDFTIPLEKSIPELASKHTKDGSIIDTPALRDDVMCVLVGAVDDGMLLERIADTCHEARHFSGVEFSERLMGILQYIMSNSPIWERVSLEWEAKKSTKPLDALVYSLRVLRNTIENEAVDLVHQGLPQFFDNDNRIPNAMAFSVLQVRKTVLTSAWITSALSVCSKDEVGALSVGNPFALLDFFNTAVLRLVLDNTDDLLDPARLPEFLHYDRERLILVRLELSLCSFKPKVLMEYINSERWMGDGIPGPSFLGMVEKFRKILVFSRWVHGDSVCPLIVGMARAAISG